VVHLARGGGLGVGPGAHALLSPSPQGQLDIDGMEATLSDLKLDEY
jgi:hypothetical protein